MIHAICDFCGKETGLTGVLLSLTPFQNFARYHTAVTPFGNTDPTASFVICHNCLEKHQLPNPHHSYSGIHSQIMRYDKNLDNYTQDDISQDIKAQTEKQNKQTPD